MFLGSAQNHVTYAANVSSDSGGCAWKNWKTNSTGSLKVVYDQINAKKPVIMHVKGIGGFSKSTEHWILIIGYQNVSDVNNIGLGNLVALDPYDGTVITVSSRYARYSDNRLQLSNSGWTVSGHTHSYPVANVSYYHSWSHTITYGKCSCGATRAEQKENHDFQWYGLTNKCSKCGAVFDMYESTGEYFTNAQAPLYQGPGFNQAVLATIPAHTVITPLEKPRDYAAGRWQLKVSYGGKTGYVFATDVTPNESGGVHNWVNHTCTICGMQEPPSTTGTYTITKKKTIYKDNALRGEQKVLQPGDTLYVTKVEISSTGWLWGWNDNGYTFEMNADEMELKSPLYSFGPISSIPNGVYYVRSAINSGYNLDVYNASTEARANLQLWRYNGSKAQRFEFMRNGDGTYTIKNVNSGKVIEAADASIASGSNIFQYDYHSNGHPNQRWYLEATSNGTYALRNKNSNLYLDVYNGVAGDGTNIQQCRGNGTNAQQFYIEPVESINNGWLKTNGAWYYYQSGKLVKGWKSINGTWYYLNSNSGVMSVGWAKVGNDWYYLNSSGAMVTGWKSINGTWYYLKASGAMATGWQKINNVWYYFKSSGAMATGWQKVGDTWYYLQSSGATATGWTKLGNAWYYLGSDGAMRTGWQHIGSAWYYFKSSGAMATGWYKAGDDWYYSNASGVMLSNRWLGDYYLTSSGAMATNRWVSRYYVGSDGKWMRGYCGPRNDDASFFAMARAGLYIPGNRRVTWDVSGPYYWTGTDMYYWYVQCYENSECVASAKCSGDGDPVGNIMTYSR